MTTQTLPRWTPAAGLSRLLWWLLDALGQLPWAAPAEEDARLRCMALVGRAREFVPLPAGWYVFVAGPTDAGPDPGGCGPDYVAFVVPAGGTWRASSRSLSCPCRALEVAASSHRYEEEAGRALSCVELFRDTRENRTRPLHPPCGALRFEVPAGGALLAFEGGGDGEMRALDGELELVGERGWRLALVHQGAPPL